MRSVSASNKRILKKKLETFLLFIINSQALSHWRVHQRPKLEVIVKFLEIHDSMHYLAKCDLAKKKFRGPKCRWVVNCSCECTKDGILINVDIKN